MTIVLLLVIAEIIASSKSEDIVNAAETSQSICAGTSPTVHTETVTKPINQISLTKDEIELIALVTMAEAESESDYGKRLVIDTILNRMESDSFPNTISEVVYQPNQFESLWNGRIDRCYVSDDICKLVLDECIKRQNEEVVFFCAGGYSDYGTPLFQVENHYFSSI